MCILYRWPNPKPTPVQASDLNQNVLFISARLFFHAFDIYNLTLQHVSAPTHHLGHTLDVDVTRDELAAESVCHRRLSEHWHIVAKSASDEFVAVGDN